MDNSPDSSNNGDFLDDWGEDVDFSDHLLFFDHWSVDVVDFFLPDDVLDDRLGDQGLGRSLDDRVPHDLFVLGGVDNVL